MKTTGSLKRVYMPLKGQVVNPLDKYPPNDPCPCASGKKWKKRCRQKTQLFIQESDAAAVREAIKAVRQIHGKK